MTFESLFGDLIHLKTPKINIFDIHYSFEQENQTKTVNDLRVDMQLKLTIQSNPTYTSTYNETRFGIIWSNKGWYVIKPFNQSIFII